MTPDERKALFQKAQAQILRVSLFKRLRDCGVQFDAADLPMIETLALWEILRAAERGGN